MGRRIYGVFLCILILTGFTGSALASSDRDGDGVEDSADFEQVFGSLADLPVLVVESPLECDVSARVIEGSECKCRPPADGDSVVARDKNCFEAFRVADGTQGCSGGLATQRVVVCCCDL
jgi:hypothetical protein